MESLKRSDAKSKLTDEVSPAEDKFSVMNVLCLDARASVSSGISCDAYGAIEAAKRLLECRAS